MKQHRTLIIGLAMVALIAGGAVAALAVSSDGPGSPHEYTAAEDGAAVEIAAGESFTPVLQRKPTPAEGGRGEGLGSERLRGTLHIPLPRGGGGDDSGPSGIPAFVGVSRADSGIRHH